MHESTKLTNSLILQTTILQHKERKVQMATTAQQSQMVLFEAMDEEEEASDDDRQSVSGSGVKARYARMMQTQEETMAPSDETLIQLLQANGAANETLVTRCALKHHAAKGSPYRFFRSLKFRAKRRTLKTKLSGHPFTMRESVKNLNRSTAALKRKRDIEGKFLDVPISTREHQCQIFQSRVPDGPIFAVEVCLEKRKLKQKLERSSNHVRNTQSAYEERKDCE